MTKHAVCCSCGSPVYDIERGWLRNQSNTADRRVWFVCERCLDDQVAFDWSSRGPRVRARVAA